MSTFRPFSGGGRGSLGKTTDPAKLLQQQQASRRKSLVAPGATEELPLGFHRGSVPLTVGQRVFQQQSQNARTGAAQVAGGIQGEPPMPFDFLNADIGSPGMDRPSGISSFDSRPFFSTFEKDPVKSSSPLIRSGATNESLLSFFAGGEGRNQGVKDVNIGLRSGEIGSGDAKPIFLGGGDTILGQEGRTTKTNIERQPEVDSTFFSEFNITKPSGKFDKNGNFLGLNNPTGNTVIDSAFAKMFNPRSSMTERAAAQESLRNEQEVLLNNTAIGQSFLQNLDRRTKARLAELSKSDKDLFSALKGGVGLDISLKDRIELENANRLESANVAMENQKTSAVNEANRKRKELEARQSKEVNQKKSEYDDRIREALQAEGFDTDRSGEGLTRSELDRASAIENKLIEQRDREISAIEARGRAEYNKIDTDEFDTTSKLAADFIALQDQIAAEGIQALRGEEKINQEGVAAEQKARLDLASFKSKELFKAAVEEQLADVGLTTDQLVLALQRVSNTDDPTAFLTQMQLLDGELAQRGLNFDAGELLEAAGQRQLLNDLQIQGQQALIASRGKSGKQTGFTPFDEANAANFTDEELRMGVDSEGEKITLSQQQREDAINARAAAGIPEPSREASSWFFSDWFGNDEDDAGDISSEDEAIIAEALQ
jgi:hypothetical protein